MAGGGGDVYGNTSQHGSAWVSTDQNQLNEFSREEARCLWSPNIIVILYNNISPFGPLVPKYFIIYNNNISPLETTFSVLWGSFGYQVGYPIRIL